MRISDWSSDVCSSDLRSAAGFPRRFVRSSMPLPLSFAKELPRMPSLLKSAQSGNLMTRCEDWPNNPRVMEIPMSDQPNEIHTIDEVVAYLEADRKSVV